MVKAVVAAGLLLLSTSTVLASTSSISNDIDVSSNGGGSSVNVKVNNNVNGTNTSSTTTSTTQTKTNVNIDQSGDGHSSVTINGKEYKVDGPGSLNINESSPPTATAFTSAPDVSAEQQNIIIDLLQRLFSFLKNLV